MLSELITYYGTVIASYTQEPLNEVGYLLPICVAVSVAIRAFKDVTKD